VSQTHALVQSTAAAAAAAAAIGAMRLISTQAH